MAPTTLQHWLTGLIWDLLETETATRNEFRPYALRPRLHTCIAFISLRIVISDNFFGRLYSGVCSSQIRASMTEIDVW